MVGLPIDHEDPDIVAAPRAAGRFALQTDMVEDGSGLGEAAAASILLHRQDARGGDKETDLHRGRQPGQVSRADPGPLRAVGRVVASERGTFAGQPEPARELFGDVAWDAGDVVGEVVLHPHPVAAGDHHRSVGRSLCGALLDHDPGFRPRLDAGEKNDAGDIGVGGR